MNGIDWDALGSAVPVVLWILFLLLRKRGQKAPGPDDESDEEPQPLPTEQAPLRRSRRRRHDETGGFERGYDPIEPGW